MNFPVADSSFVIALADRGDRYHVIAKTLYVAESRILLPHPTLGEIAYLLERAGGKDKAIQFFQGLPASRFVPFPLDDDTIARVAQLLFTYRDTRLDFVDAAVVAVAEATGARKLLTFDRRDFGMVKPSHCNAFELPELI